MFLWEERFGIPLREAEREKQIEDAKRRADYERTVAYLKRQQEQES